MVDPSKNPYPKSQEQFDAEMRLVAIENTIKQLTIDRKEDRKKFDFFVNETFEKLVVDIRARFDGIDSRLLTFSFSIAGSAILIALTIILRT